MTHDEPVSQFHERLRAVYESRGMPVKEIAYKAGLKKLTIDNWLAPSKQTMPKVTEAAKVAKVLGTTIEYLVFGVEADAVPERLKEVVGLLSSMENEDLETVVILARTMSERSAKKRYHYHESAMGSAS